MRICHHPVSPRIVHTLGSHAAHDHNNPSSPPRTLGPARRGGYAYTTQTTLVIVLGADRAAETGCGSLAATANASLFVLHLSIVPTTAM